MDRSATVLVVDDEADTVDLIRLTLETAGYRVEQALDGSSALQKLEANSYDVLLLDIMMPDITGFDVLQKLHSSGGEVPPTVFLTARTEADDQKTGEDLGAIGYLTKPARRGELLDAIEGALKAKRA